MMKKLTILRESMRLLKKRYRHSNKIWPFPKTVLLLEITHLSLRYNSTLLSIYQFDYFNLRSVRDLISHTDRE